MRRIFALLLALLAVLVALAIHWSDNTDSSAAKPPAHAIVNSPPNLSRMRFALEHALPHGHAFQYFWLFDAFANARALAEPGQESAQFAQADALCFFGTAESSTSASYLLYRLGKYHAFTGTFSLLQIFIPHSAIAVNGSINPSLCKTEELQQNIIGMRIRYLYSDDGQLPPEFIDIAWPGALDEEALSLELRRRAGNPLHDPAYQFTLVVGAAQGLRAIPNNTAHRGLPFNEDQFAQKFLNPLEGGFHPLIESRLADFKLRNAAAHNAPGASANIALTRFKVGVTDEHADPMTPLPTGGHWANVMRLMGLGDTAPSCLVKPLPQMLEVTLTLRNPRNAVIYTHTELLRVGMPQ